MHSPPKLATTAHTIGAHAEPPVTTAERAQHWAEECLLSAMAQASAGRPGKARKWAAAANEILEARLKLLDTDFIAADAPA